MVEITVSVSQDDAQQIEQLLRQEDPNLLRAESQGADGKLIVELVVTLTPALIALLVKLREKRLAANKYIQLKYKGLEIKGVSEATLLKLIDRVGPKAKKP